MKKLQSMTNRSVAVIRQMVKWCIALTARKRFLSPELQLPSYVSISVAVDISRVIGEESQNSLSIDDRTISHLNPSLSLSLEWNIVSDGN